MGNLKCYQTYTISIFLERLLRDPLPTSVVGSNFQRLFSQLRLRNMPTQLSYHLKLTAT